MKDYSAKQSPKKKVVAEPRSMNLKKGFRQLIKSILSLLAIALVVYIVVHLPGYYDHPINPKKVNIRGNQILSNDEILLYLQIPKDQSWMDTDPYELSRRLTRHPWVDHATVHRNPDLGLSILISEITPISYLKTGEGLFLLGSDYRVLSMKFSGGQWDLPVLVDRNLKGLKPGKVIPRPELSKGLAMIEFLKNNEILPLKNVSEIDLTDPLNIQLITIPDAIRIKLGTSGFEEKLINLSHALAELQGERGNIRYIDLRYEWAVVYRNKV